MFLQILYLVLFLLFLIVTIFITISFFIQIFFIKVPFVPINRNTNKEILRYIKENDLFKDVKVFYDLGSGDGRVLFLLAKEYPEIKFVGYEISFIPYFFSKIKNYFYKLHFNFTQKDSDIIKNKYNLSFKRKDFLKENLSSADFIFTYLFPFVLEKLSKKLKKEVKMNTKILSCDFCVTDILLEKEYDLPNVRNKRFNINRKLYLYIL